MSQITFGTVMLCYLKSDHPDIIQRVEAIRDEVIERAQNGEEDLVFNSLMFHAVMQAHSRYGDPEDAEFLLDQLCREVLEGKNEQNWELNSHSFNSVLRAWIRANHPERAEAILKKMCQFRDHNLANIRPTPRNYIDVIESWTRSAQPAAGDRADDALQMLETDFSGVEAGKGLYLAVMKALAQSGSGERAEALLRRVHALSDIENYNTEMDLFMYREACLAWKKSNNAEATKHIQRLEIEIAQKFPNARKAV